LNNTRDDTLQLRTSIVFTTTVYSYSRISALHYSILSDLVTMESNGNSIDSSNDANHDDLGSASDPLNTTSAIDTTAGNKSTNTVMDTSTKSINPDDGTITTANTTTTTTTPSAPPILSKNRKKKLEKIERTKKKKLERKEREKVRKRAEAISQGRDLDAERKVMEERTKLGEGRKRSDEMWATKLVDARSRFEICIDLGGRQCNDNNSNKDDDNNDDSNDLMLSNFEKVMREREIASLAQQIRYCYSYNKRSPNPVLTAVTGLSKKSSNTNTNINTDHNLTTVRAVLERESGFGEWNRRLFDCNEQSLEDYYGLVNDNKDNKNKNIEGKEDINNEDSSDENKEDKEVRVSLLSKSNKKKIVYLTSDSTTTLDTLSDDTIYVIGGIVDRNRLKYATINRAEKELNVSTAKLPLTEYLTSTTPISTTTKSKNEEIRNVPLTVNHVFDIMLKYKQYNNDWERAFQDVLPSRKDKDVVVKNDLDAGVVADVADNNKNGNNNKRKFAGSDSNNNNNNNNK
jgi:tRNA (guanine9-N1)-methyltransferase